MNEHMGRQPFTEGPLRAFSSLLTPQVNSEGHSHFMVEDLEAQRLSNFTRVTEPVTGRAEKRTWVYFGSKACALLT